MNTWYEGMEAANEAQLQFERKHAGHRTIQQPSENLNTIVTRCIDCGEEFREYFTSDSRP